ncbi:hypothetical protein PCASD_21238 [Puccinia coronata f. sp. avenae]|uniref:Uncharacterized protein n=1 Tax=Puccinia coronata f. sp. avenae TaxID=200324 RepID=A0A2N5TNK4_9BASI|nr:hypothetical protein PCASD_21238 [Puccinia coronata f. sp. avenae]
MAQPNEHSIDFGTLSHSTLPDLTLIHQPKLTLDLGTPSLEASIHQHLSQEEEQQQQDEQQQPSTTTSTEPPLHQELDTHRSRRWTSLSELGRAVLRPSLSKSHLKLGSLNERTTHSYSARFPPSRRMSDSTHTLPTPSIYSTCRHNKHLFKLWNHVEPTIEGSPAHTPIGNTFPSLPPMSELLGDSSILQFNQQDLSSITEPINTYQHDDDAAVDDDDTPTKPTPSILSAPVPALVSQLAPPPSPPSSPSPMLSSSPSLASSSSSSAAASASSSSPSSLAANNPAAFSSAVQSPNAADIPLPKTPSLKSCASSLPIGAVPTIERVLSKAEEGEEDKLISSKVVNSPSPAEHPVVGGTGNNGEQLSEGPVAGENSVAVAAAAAAKEEEEDTTVKTQNPTSMTHTTTPHARTNLTGLLSRKKKPHPTAASSGSGTPSFFKLFLLKGLGLKSSPSPAS